MNRRTFIRTTSSATICWAAAISARAQTAIPSPEARLREFAARLPTHQRRCATEPPDTASFRQTLGRAARVAEADLFFEARVPVVVHVVHDGSRNRIGQDRIERQIAVLNADFATARIRFDLKAVRYHDNGQWARSIPSRFAAQLQLPDYETEMKAALSQSAIDTLNVYVLEPAIEQILGWARFPWDLAINPRQDGIVVAHKTLPGNPQEPSRLGRTATHEVGHWLGLLHTFQNGCEEPGDGIADTAFHAAPSNQCTPPPNQCEQPGQALDGAPNLMDYVDDTCDPQFTPGQLERMRTMIRVFRPRLIRSEPGLADTARNTETRRLNAIIND